MESSTQDSNGGGQAGSKEFKCRGGFQEVKLPTIESSCRHAISSHLFDERVHENTGKSLSKSLRLEVVMEGIKIPEGNVNKNTKIAFRSKYYHGDTDWKIRSEIDQSLARGGKEAERHGGGEFEGEQRLALLEAENHKKPKEYSPSELLKWEDVERFISAEKCSFVVYDLVDACGERVGKAEKIIIWFLNKHAEFLAWESVE
eukprot:749622-Hanusia_phi.AAC.1